MIAKGDSVAVGLSDREIRRGEDRVGKDSLFPILEARGCRKHHFIDFPSLKGSTRSAYTLSFVQPLPSNHPVSIEGNIVVIFILQIERTAPDTSPLTGFHLCVSSYLESRVVLSSID